jgi:hypothetical protein
MRSGDSTTIDVPESKKDVPESSAIAKGKAPLVAVVAKQRGGWKRGVAIFDFLLRIGAITAALAAASIMGTSQETLPFFTQFFQFQASYSDLPTFQYVIIFNLSLSLASSIFYFLISGHGSGFRTLDSIFHERQRPNDLPLEPTLSGLALIFSTISFHIHTRKREEFELVTYASLSVVRFISCKCFKT